MSERILVRKIEHNLWQWRDVSSQGGWAADAYYTGDINLLKESAQGRSVWLVLPGQNVVSQKVAADIKDRAQLLKVLPFEIEDNVIDPVEDMHFAYGEIKDGMISVAYGDFEWLTECVEEVEQVGSDVALCSVDYLQLPKNDGGWTFMLENGMVMALTADGEGFCVEQSMAPLYLGALESKPLPQSLTLYGDSEESLYALNQLLPRALTETEELNIDESEASLWDLISPDVPLRANFRSGRLARKLPFAKWWADYKVPIIAAAAAFVLAITTTWLSASKVESERKTIMAQTDAIYRQVVPTGKITEPGRQLRGLLGNSGASTADPSNAVALIAGVAPSISSIESLKVKSFRYNVSKGELQMNIEGSSYDDFEALRGKISKSGFEVDIKNQSAFGEVFQAQMRVVEAS